MTKSEEWLYGHVKNWEIKIVPRTPEDVNKLLIICFAIVESLNGN